VESGGNRAGNSGVGLEGSLSAASCLRWKTGLFMLG